MTPDKLTKQILADGIPEWNNPGFTDTMMRRVMAAETRKTRRRLLLIMSAVIAVIVLTGYALVNLVKTKPSALSVPVNGLGQIGAWISAEEYFFLPLVLLLLTKILIDSRHSSTIRNAGS